MRVLLCVLLIDFAKNGDGRKYDNYGENAHINKRIVENLPVFDRPVPFGHITREGFEDPFSPVKQPIDRLELRLRPKPKDNHEALELLKKSPRSAILFLDPDIPKYFARANPKEEMLMETPLNPPPETNETELKWYDFAAMQAKNFMTRPISQHVPNRKSVPVVPPSSVNVEKGKFFSATSFQLGNDRPEVLSNWTTCDEFAVGAVFSPKDIVDLKWTPFYIWGSIGFDVAVEHTFRYPSKKLVYEYQRKYSKYLRKNVDWTKTKLLMEGLGEALLVAVDKRGLFDVIVKHEIPEFLPASALLPSMSLRIKIEDPYLVLTYCENQFATLMALSGNEPTDAKEMRDEAATIKFVGPGRPVWRDYFAEKQQIDRKNRAKIIEEN